MYQQFINPLAKKEYSKRTIEIIHSTIYNAFEKAIVLGKVEKNPCIGVTIKAKQKGFEIKFIESEHIASFLQTFYEYGYIYWIFYKVLLKLGCVKAKLHPFSGQI